MTDTPAPIAPAPIPATVEELRGIRRMAGIYLIVAVLISGLMLLFANALANGNLNQVKDARYLSCQARNTENAQLAANARSRYGPMYVKAQASATTDPVLIQLLGALATTQPSIVVCTR